MKQNKICKKLITLASITMLSMAALSSPAATLSAKASAPTATEQSISPRAHDIRWVYMEINGVLHKRLYDFTAASFVTGSTWIPVG